MPLLDHKLMELACRIPASLKIKGRSTKYILRKTMEGKLPANVLKQRKQGFAVPLQRWFQGELLPAAKKLLLSEDTQSRRYFRPSYMKWLLEEHASGRQRFGTQIHALVVFELWCRLGLGKNQPGEISGWRLKDIAR